VVAAEPGRCPNWALGVVAAEPGRCPSWAVGVVAADPGRCPNWAVGVVPGRCPNWAVGVVAADPDRCPNWAVVVVVVNSIVPRFRGRDIQRYIGQEAFREDASHYSYSRRGLMLLQIVEGTIGQICDI
jgi:hypothetical protein